MHFSSIATYKRYELVAQDVDTTQAVLTPPPSGKRAEKIRVQALHANTGTIMIGATGLATDGSTGGLELKSGEYYDLFTNMHEALYARASGSGQKLLITYLSGAN